MAQSSSAAQYGSMHQNKNLSLATNEWVHSLASQEKRVAYMQQEMSPGPGDYNARKGVEIGSRPRGVGWARGANRKRVAAPPSAAAAAAVPRYMRDTRSYRNQKSGVDIAMVQAADGRGRTAAAEAAAALSPRNRASPQAAGAAAWSLSSSPPPLKLRTHTSEGAAAAALSPPLDVRREETRREA
eukprot:Rhum_TRINITY_DN9433_c0_g1::Rhum_TRINITY_DN9433_c0_g1_i1::g.33492::m.33492